MFLSSLLGELAVTFRYINMREAVLLLSYHCLNDSEKTTLTRASSIARKATDEQLLKSAVTDR